MNTIEELIKERISEIKQLQEELEIEDIEEITVLVKKHYANLPVSRYFGPDKMFSRALSFAAADLSKGDTGENVELAILGYQPPRDWNEADRIKILADWEKGPAAQAKLLDEGKVVYMKTRDGRKAVSKIEKIEKDDSGVPHVIEGVIVEGDAKPIPRDWNEITTYKNGDTKPNKHYGYALGTKWAINVFGLTTDGEKDIVFEANIYDNYDGKWANPNSDDYLPKNCPAFAFYNASVYINKDKQVPDKLIIGGLNAIKPKTIMITDVVVDIQDGVSEEIEVERPLEFIEYIYQLMDVEEGEWSPIVDFRKYLAADGADQAEMLEAPIEFLVSFKHLREFHEIYGKKDKNGVTDWGKGGKKNYTDWGARAIGVPIVKKEKDTSNGNVMISFSTGGNCFIDPAISPRPEIKKSCECLVSFNTVKASTKYDFKTRKNTEDKANGDVNVNNVFGLLKTYELMD